jgi:formiminotetrahydrofolate cyclodeaminase
LTRGASLAGSLALSLRSLVITLARGQKKRRQQERHSG